jgi:type VI secretion system protein ImpK
MSQGYYRLMDRIGSALREEKGPVQVIGYTDNQPIHTVQFPSNWQLSQARADAVAKVLAAHLSDPKRVRAVGKGDAEPIAPNNTPDGRQSNRRTEIVVVKTAMQP